ncbi:MAG: dihydroorotase [Alphaproteobacteria bacterium]|nr:dihydroorotase [Alphaproteobacteria bacterium]
MHDRPLFFTNARLIDPSRHMDTLGSLLIENGSIKASSNALPPLPENAKNWENSEIPENSEIVDCKGMVLSPGIVDMRVFIGEPGAEHRETLASASQAAAAGGVTTIACMPDTEPVIDDVALVDFLLRRARDTAVVNICPTAAITRGLNGEKMTEFGLMLEAGAVSFTDGRRSITNTQIMRQALIYARNFGALIQHHCEDHYLAHKGTMNEGEIATRLGLSGIPREAESIILARDTNLALLTGSRYHAAQISHALSLELIRRTKKETDMITCGVSINHLTLNELDIGPYRTFFKISPPLRTEEDRCSVVAGVADGTIDVIVSSHDPQHVETKRLPFSEAANGTIGLETLLAAALRLVHNGDVSLLRIMHALSTRPAELLGLRCGTLQVGAPADLILFDLYEPWIFRKTEIISHSKNTPHENKQFQGRVKRTLVAGKTVYAHF